MRAPARPTTLVPAANDLRDLLTPRFTQNGLALALRAAAKRRRMKIRVAQSTVSTWARGAFRPELPVRELLEEVAGIPKERWLTTAELRLLEHAARGNGKGKRSKAA